MKKYLRLILFAILLAAGLAALRYSGLSWGQLPGLRERFLALGQGAFFAYFALYTAGCLLLLPGLPLTVLGAALFGPLWGTLYTVVSASAGLALAFLAARYTARGLITERFGRSEAFQKIDAGVKTQGWRILMITRLVPLFPFTIQNYIYGLTDIPFFLYWGLSTLLIIPGTAAYTLSAGAVLEGRFSPKTLAYLGAGAACFALLSLIPKWIKPQK